MPTLPACTPIRPAPLQSLAPVVAPVLRKLDRTRWQRAWSWEREQPDSELASVVPRELVEAVERGGVPPDSAVMDVRAGAGQIAAWLAERGFRVFGPDLSAEATALATRRYPHLRERIEFRTLDLCTAPPVPGRFDWIVDRGCFHVIPEALAPRYVANLATRAKPRAKLLLFSRKGRVDSVPHFFAPHFEIVRTAPYLYTRSAGPRPQQTSQGKVFWMVRR